MPLYIYEHATNNPNCPRDKEFRWEQPAQDWPLTKCPWCGDPVARVMAPSLLKIKKFDCELKDQGFTKLVRVDEGLFENRTRRAGEPKYVDRHNPETFPILEKTIKD